MTNTLRIGILAQSEIPKQLEVLIESIFREQFKKLNLILGLGNVTLISSIEDKASELACISAIEEGLKLELAPIEKTLNLDEPKAEIKKKIHKILEKQPGATVSGRHHSEAEMTQLCDIIMFVFDKSDPNRISEFDMMRQNFFGNDFGEPARAKLSIEINVPRVWTPDADSEVYFDYIVRIPSQRSMSSEIEIPEQIIQQWKEKISKFIYFWIQISRVKFVNLNLDCVIF